MAWATAAARRFRRLVRHAARIRYRLLLINVLVAAVPLVGISFAQMHESQLLGALEQDMIHQAELVRALVLSENLPLERREAILREAARDTRTRIRLLDTTGTVIADSHRVGPPEGAERPVPHLLRGESPSHDPVVPKPVPLADRREVKAALAGHYGSATRLWGGQERVYLFGALPIIRGGNVEGVIYVTRSTHDVKMQLFRLRSWLGKLLIATLIGTALLSLLLSTTIARPLARLTKRAQRISARQPTRADDKLVKRADEIGQLARAVEAMTDELERRARDARTLAADISHEFKTPLAGIRGAAELLRDGAADEPDARDRFLAMILEDAARLDRQVSRLLELARVDDDRGVALPVDLAELARTCAGRSWPTRVEVEVGCEAVVEGRSSQLAAAIENLVANATQHADRGTPVRVEIERLGFAEPRSNAQRCAVQEVRRDAMVRVSVANCGPALSTVARTKVWDRFYSTRVAAGGSGLGLAIVRSVALAHGGNVGVECNDGTTTFWFEVRDQV